MKLKPTLGWCRTKPPHELLMQQNGDSVAVQCSKLQNYVCKSTGVYKIGGTRCYNADADTGQPIPWLKRSYHIREDGFVKKTLLFSYGTIYSRDDASGDLTEQETGLTPDAIPLDFTMQVSGNSILYILTGQDAVRKYDGNSGYVIDEVSTDDLSSNYESGIVHLDRAWYVTKNSSKISYSESLTPETIEDEFIVGNDKNSFVRRIVRGAGENVYFFKNNSIWQLFGRTTSQFQVRLVTNKYGLASKKTIYPASGGFVFLDEYTKELCFFGGTEASITSLTERDIKLREIIDDTPTSVERFDMTVHNGLFRFAFNHIDADLDYNTHELIYVLDEPRSDNLPRWSLIKGSNVECYSVWNQQGDKEELITGRSDCGKVMHHNQGRDFDEVAIETKVRFAEITTSEDKVVRFKDFFVKAKPGSANLKSTFNYYLNGRISNRGTDNLNMEGETRTVGTIKLQQSVLFNDRIVPLTEYTRGNSISFEIEDNNVGTDMEIYSIAFKARELYKLRNQYV